MHWTPCHLLHVDCGGGQPKGRLAQAHRVIADSRERVALKARENTAGGGSPVIRTPRLSLAEMVERALE